MIECPYCSSEIEITNGRCPECKRRLAEVDEEDFEESEAFDDSYASSEDSYMSIEDLIADRYRCSKCQCEECETKEVAMTGTGLSKLFDIQHNHFLFVSCANCGFVEVYNPDILRRQKSGQLGTVLDILFGS